MEIEIDPGSGFCFGVQKAIERAEEELNSQDSIYCLGEIVHNDAEIHRLNKRGLKTISHEQFKKLHDISVLIRAHGEPPETYEIAKKNHINMIDATCPIVSKLQNRIKTCYDEILDEGGQIVIYGKEGHPEVLGLVGQTQGKAIVITGEDNIDRIDFKRPIYLYSQTTKSKVGFRKIQKTIKDKIKEQKNGSSLHFLAHQTLCGQVSNREPGLKKFARNHDTIIFASGTNSSNGKMLYEVCKSVNENSYFVSSVSEVTRVMITGSASVGISGATSTPSWLLEEVAEKVKQLTRIQR